MNSSINKLVIVGRDCEAIQIPSGEPVKISEGTRVRIIQALGGDYTAMTEQGYLVRISGKDAGAIGEKPAPAPTALDSGASAEPQEVEKQVWNQLRTCYDPEIPVNIVDLGLVYSCVIAPLPEGGNRVQITMTLTAPGCGMGEVLKNDIEHKMLSVPGVTEASVEIVFDPPWDRSRMSEAALLQLGMLW
ncbi:MAG: putative Fe-S cluster assembly protein SufT [Acidobacteria bacterium]|nr:putative Fe-S cluster assembly protein SufT [Acidobacteriota bacterium]